jgi:esterase/lipase superfamily enzyme
VFGHAGARTLVFPTRAGRFFDYENWGMVHALQHHLENGWLQLFCVDSVDADGLYCCWCHPRDRITRHVQYQSYIINEVVPLMEYKNPTPFFIAHGCSLGAYHAVNIAFRYPHLFGKVLALSGRYDLTRQIGVFRDLFDGYYDDDIYFNTPCHFIPNMADHHSLEMLRRMNITLVIGEDDAFHQNNHELSTSLWEKGVWNALRVWHGEAHKPRFWRQMVAMYL